MLFTEPLITTVSLQKIVQPVVDLSEWESAVFCKTIKTVTHFFLNKLCKFLNTASKIHIFEVLQVIYFCVYYLCILTPYFFLQILTESKWAEEHQEHLTTPATNFKSEWNQRNQRLKPKYQHKWFSTVDSSNFRYQIRAVWLKPSVRWRADRS